MITSSSGRSPGNLTARTHGWGQYPDSCAALTGCLRSIVCVAAVRRGAVTQCRDLAANLAVWERVAVDFRVRIAGLDRVRDAGEITRRDSLRGGTDDVGRGDGAGDRARG